MTHYTVENQIAQITLNRPEKRNALNPEMVSSIKANLKKAELDTSIKIIVIKATGKSFCSGADLDHLQHLQQNSYEENLSDSQHLKELFEQIYYHPKVIIAQVEGHAIAGGAGLVTVCDFVFSIPDIKIGFTEVKIGFVPAIISPFLIRKVRETKAKELLLTGDLISAEKAFNIGIVNRIYDKENIDIEVKQFALNICKNTSSDSLRQTKKLIADIQSMDIHDALNFAAKLNASARDTPDCKKGISAFLNKENPVW